MRKREPKRNFARLGLFAAWLPHLETEADAYPLRFRGPLPAAGYRHAIACVNGQVPRDAAVRVAVRDTTDATRSLIVFELRLEGNETISELIEGS